MNKIIFAIVFAFEIASASSADDVESIVRDLGSENRSTRVFAMEKAAQMRALPAALVAPVAQAIRGDVDTVFTANGAKPKRRDKPINSTDLKLDQSRDDTTILRIKANPAKFYGSEFTMVVGMTISDRYPSGGIYSRDVFSAFEVEQFASDGRYQPGSSGHAYLLRGASLGLSEYIAAAVEGGASHILARLKCTTRQVLKEVDDPEDLLEIKDWQFYDFETNKWKPWAFDGISFGLRSLKNAEAVGSDELASIVGSERLMASKFIDDVVRSLAATLLCEMILNTDDRKNLAGKIMARRQEVARWGDQHPKETILKECDKILQAIQPKPTETARQKTAKPADPAQRAATILQGAKNLEKAGKTQPAIESYCRIVKDFPETSSAKAATARLKELGVK
jgi:hypothetical protein